MSGKRKITAAEASWEQSIIPHDAMDMLFDSVDMPLQVPREVAQLLLSKQTTQFAWCFFDKKPSIEKVKLWDLQFQEFQQATSELAYPPNKYAMAKIREWLQHEKQRKTRLGRPPNDLDEIIFPWLTAFFAECFERTDKTPSNTSQCARFIKLYLKEFERSVEQVEVVDPQQQGRQLFTEWLSPTMREDEAYRKAVDRFCGKADRERAQIRGGLRV